jgi:hypothetical protein
MSAFEREKRGRRAVIRATRLETKRGAATREAATGSAPVGPRAIDVQLDGPITEGCLSIKTMAIVATPSESKFNRLFTHSQPSDTVRDVLFATAPSRFRVTLP